jgi:hypothetical protein
MSQEMTENLTFFFYGTASALASEQLFQFEEPLVFDLVRALGSKVQQLKMTNQILLIL